MAAPAPATFSDLLRQAVTEPGTISSAYSAFHNYSLGNQLLAWAQCLNRGIKPGPLATFPKWKELGRYVRKGEKAITLCQPVTVKRKAQQDTTDDDVVFTRFVYRRSWFVLSQTEGEELAQSDVPAWDKARALSALGVEETPFDCLDGNVQGFARQRQIAVNPVCPHPWKTTLHEIAHVLLGHTSESDLNDSELTPRDVREVEAEATALLCLEALGLPGAELCRGYIQHWWGQGNPIPERSAQKILKAADQILKAGRDDQSQGVSR